MIAPCCCAVFWASFFLSGFGTRRGVSAITRHRQRAASAPRRTSSVEADPDGRADDGSSADTKPGASARDNILPDVEDLVGGSGGDTLAGNGLSNLLEGGDGRDLLVGRGGSDRLFGGAGNDKLAARDGEADRSLFCGESSGDSDFLVADRLDPTGRECERVDRP